MNDAHLFMEKTLLTKDDNSVVLFTPPDGSFPVADEFLAFKKFGTVSFFIFQDKAGKELVDDAVPDFVENAILFRGLPAEATVKRSPKWIYLDKAPLLNFMGVSLSELVPFFIKQRK